MKLKAELGFGYVFEEDLSEEEELKWKAGVWNIADIIMRRKS